MGNTWFGRHSFAKKAVGVLCLFAFFVNFSMADAHAALDMGGGPYGMPVAPPAYGQFATLDVDTFSIPAHLGEIKHAFKGTSDKFVVHLQDAHCNFYAQHKISDIIDYLTGEYGIRLVNLEGGVGDYDLDVFTSISGQAIRREVADHFVKKGEINGAEFYAINNPEKVRLWGVEDKDLYLANLKIYRDSLAYKDEVEKYLKELTYIMNNLKRHIYTPELLKLDMAYSAYKAGNKPFREYLEFLIARAASAGIGVKRFENLHLLARAMKREEGIDFKKANIQRNILVDELKKGLSNNEVRGLVSKSVAFKTKRISRKGFYDYLLKKARSMMINIGRFPALTSYIEYVTVYESVDRSAVMEEMDALEAAIKEPLYRSDTQRRLNALSRNLALMKNIFAISLTVNDYRYYLENRDSFAVANFVKFIEREAPRCRIDARPSADIGRLDECRERIEKFFEYSFTRDEVFLKNMRFGPAPGETESAMLMTGGFHTESLCGLFKKEGISYVSIMPKFTSEKGYESPYFDLLAGRTTDLRRMLSSAIAKVCMMQVPPILNRIIALAEFGKSGLKAFMVEAWLVEQIVRGKIMENVTVKDADVIFHLKDGQKEQMGIGPLLDDIHQTQIDTQLKKAEFYDIDDLNAILDDMKEFLKSTDASKELLDQVDALKGTHERDGQRVALVQLAKGIDFDGHAGGWGIRVNYDLEGDATELRKGILHEFIAGFGGDHFLAKELTKEFGRWLEKKAEKGLEGKLANPPNAPPVLVDLEKIKSLDDDGIEKLRQVKKEEDARIEELYKQAELSYTQISYQIAEYKFAFLKAIVLLLMEESPESYKDVFVSCFGSMSKRSQMTLNSDIDLIVFGKDETCSEAVLFLQKRIEEISEKIGFETDDIIAQRINNKPVDKILELFDPKRQENWDHFPEFDMTIFNERDFILPIAYLAGAEFVYGNRETFESFREKTVPFIFGDKKDQFFHHPEKNEYVYPGKLLLENDFHHEWEGIQAERTNLTGGKYDVKKIIRAINYFLLSARVKFNIPDSQDPLETISILTEKYEFFNEAQKEQMFSLYEFFLKIKAEIPKFMEKDIFMPKEFIQLKQYIIKKDKIEKLSEQFGMTFDELIDQFVNHLKSLKDILADKREMLCQKPDLVLMQAEDVDGPGQKIAGQRTALGLASLADKPIWYEEVTRKGGMWDYASLEGGNSERDWMKIGLEADLVVESDLNGKWDRVKRIIPVGISKDERAFLYGVFVRLGAKIADKEKMKVFDRTVCSMQRVAAKAAKDRKNALDDKWAFKALLATLYLDSYDLIDSAVLEKNYKGNGQLKESLLTAVGDMAQVLLHMRAQSGKYRDLLKAKNDMLHVLVLMAAVRSVDGDETDDEKINFAQRIYDIQSDEGNFGKIELPKEQSLKDLLDMATDGIFNRENNFCPEKMVTAIKTALQQDEAGRTNGEATEVPGSNYNGGSKFQRIAAKAGSGENWKELVREVYKNLMNLKNLKDNADKLTQIEIARLDALEEDARFEGQTGCGNMLYILERLNGMALAYVKSGKDFDEFLKSRAVAKIASEVKELKKWHEKSKLYKAELALVLACHYKRNNSEKKLKDIVNELKEEKNNGFSGFEWILDNIIENKQTKDNKQVLADKAGGTNNEEYVYRSKLQEIAERGRYRDYKYDGYEWEDAALEVERYAREVYTNLKDQKNFNPKKFKKNETLLAQIAAVLKTQEDKYALFDGKTGCSRIWIILYHLNRAALHYYKEKKTILFDESKLKELEKRHKKSKGYKPELALMLYYHYKNYKKIGNDKRAATFAEELSEARKKGFVKGFEWIFKGESPGTIGVQLENARVEDKGDHIVISSGNEAEIKIDKARDDNGKSITRDARKVRESFKKKLGQRKQHLTEKEKVYLENGISELFDGAIEIVAIEDNDKVKGIPRTNTRGGKVLYLNKRLIDNVLGIVHESGESLSEIPPCYLDIRIKGMGDKNIDGQTVEDLWFDGKLQGFVHTLWRGVGARCLPAFNALVREKGEDAVDRMHLGEFIGELDEKRLIRPKTKNKLTLNEKVLLAVNYELRSKREHHISGPKARLYLEGLQGKLDIEGNYRFTRDISALKDDLRKGYSNFMLFPGHNHETRSTQQKHGNKAARGYRKTIHTDTVLSRFGDMKDMEERMCRIANEMDAKESQGKFPMAFVVCLTEAEKAEAVRVKKEIEKKRGAAFAGRFVIVSDSLTAEEAAAAQIREEKLVNIGAHMLNIKRMKDVFRIQGPEVQGYMASFLETLGNCDFIDSDILRDKDPKELEEIMRRLLQGDIPFRVSAVNWKELDDYENSMLELGRSL